MIRASVRVALIVVYFAALPDILPRANIDQSSRNADYKPMTESETVILIK